MADIVNIGTAANAGDGDPLRTAYIAINAEFARIANLTGTITGSPEGVTTAEPSSTRFDAAAGILYLKETGSGNTGWIAFVQI